MWQNPIEMQGVQDDDVMDAKKGINGGGVLVCGNGKVEHNYRCATDQYAG